MNASDQPSRWADAWLDGLAFAGGLALAWFGRWETADLVWSLWLSSLVVGYALIVWSLSENLREFAVNAARDRTPGLGWAKAGGGAVTGGVFLFGLGFYTLHFGGFHFVHSVFVNYFFPVHADADVARGFPTLATYGEVARRYWLFVPLALLAERAAFRTRPAIVADTAVTPDAIARRKRARWDAPLMAPYKNVIRLHLLIFFFMAAYFLRFGNFAVYAVVYAAYFFPWRVLKKRPAET